MAPTIKELARKLASLCEPNSGATEAEKSVAANKLKRLLDKHGLSDADLSAETRYDIDFQVDNEQEVALLVQVACMILECSMIQTLQCDRNIPSLSKDKKKMIKPKVVKCLRLQQITRVEAADISACFGYYVKIMRERLVELKQEKDAIKQAMDTAHIAMFHKYKIFSPHGSKRKSKDYTDSKLAAIGAAMRGLSAEKMVKPAGTIDEKNYLQMH